jgi:tetratricopeptide (TPR) repeat protein
MKGMMTLLTLFNLLLFSLSLLLPGQVRGDEDWMKRGLSGLKAQHLEEAIEAFSRAIEMNPDRVEAYNNRGIAWCNKGDYDRAIADYNKALEIDPRCADVYNNRGGVWLYKGEYDLAIHDFDKALGINPNFAKAYSNRGAGWFCKGDFELAIDDYNKALEINPNSADTNRQLAWILSVYSGNVKKDCSKAAVLPQKEEKPDTKSVSPRATLAAPIAEKGRLEIEEEAIVLTTNENLKKKPEEHITSPKPHEITESNPTPIPTTVEPPRQ